MLPRRLTSASADRLHRPLSLSVGQREPFSGDEGASLLPRQRNLDITLSRHFSPIGDTSENVSLLKPGILLENFYGQDNAHIYAKYLGYGREALAGLMSRGVV